MIKLAPSKKMIRSKTSKVSKTSGKPGSLQTYFEPGLIPIFPKKMLLYGRMSTLSSR